MKTRLTILTAVLMLSTMFGVNAQTKESKYGVDSVKTILSASLYGEMVNKRIILKLFLVGDMSSITHLNFKDQLTLMV